MWRWDQGRKNYFNFENLRLLASAAMTTDLRNASHAELKELTGLSFRPVSDAYKPWRNYQRIFKLMRLVTLDGAVAKPTEVAFHLSEPGVVTADEFIHYIICSHTDPNPSFANWNPDQIVRMPLLFSLKYILAKRSITPQVSVEINEILGAYDLSNFDGTEDDAEYATLLNNIPARSDLIARLDFQPKDVVRQGRESLKFVAQLSYLMMPNRQEIVVNLQTEAAADLFAKLFPIRVANEPDPMAHISQLAKLFAAGANDDFDLSNWDEDVTDHSGFAEGNKSQKTHLVIERNKLLRREFFKRFPTTVCDFCSLDTGNTYSWSERVLDLHHVLPLSSNVDVDKDGTTFGDLKPVCPSCHRAIHSHYSQWLASENQRDFFEPRTSVQRLYEFKI